MLDNIDKEMALDALNAAINALDAKGEYGNSDVLFELIQALRTDWEMDEDE